MQDEWEQLLRSNQQVTAQQISDFDHHRRQLRDTLTLYSRPADTLQTFFMGIVYVVYHTTRYILYHKMFLFLILPALIAWLIMNTVPGPYTPFVEELEFWVQYVVWWVGLGVLSSVGLGSGLQSGVLFLFPHIFKTCLAAQTCQSLDFDSAGDMWFRQSPSLFQCPPDNALSSSASPVTFAGMWRKIVLACFLQSAGTAIGEIPPYWMTRAARIAAQEAGGADASQMPEELEARSPYTLVNQAKEAMVWFLEQYGFWGVLVLASYPNIAFDLCGICCGHFLMPFWTFFLATFLGKAVVRNSYQSVIYVMLCSSEHLETLIGWLQFLSPDGLGWDQAIRQILQDSKQSFHSRMHSPESADSGASDSSSASTELFSFWWHLFTSSLLTLFLLSCVSHFAQYYQLLLDKEDSNQLRKRLPHATRLELSSPSTGRLKLPAPTPVLKMRRERERAKMSMTTSPSGSERKRRVDNGRSYDGTAEMEHDRLVSIGSAKKLQ